MNKVDPIVLGIIGSSPEAVLRVAERMKKDFGFRSAVPARPQNPDILQAKNRTQEADRRAKDPVTASFPAQWAESPNVLALFFKGHIEKQRTKRLVLAGPPHRSFTEALRRLGCKILYVASSEDEAVEALDGDRISCDAVLGMYGDEDQRAQHLKRALDGVLGKHPGWKGNGGKKGPSVQQNPPEKGAKLAWDVPKVNLDKHFEAVTPRWQPLLIGACFCTALDCNEAKGAWKWLWKRLVGNEALQEALGKKDDVSFGERAGDHEGVAVKAYEWISQCAQRDEEPWVSFRKDSLTEYEMAVVLSLFSIRFQGMSGEVEARDLLDLLPSGAALFDQCLKTSKNVARLRDLGWVRFIGVAPGPPGPLEGEYTLSQRAWKELSRATECPCPSEDVPEGTQLDTATLSDLILDERTWWALKDAADAWTKERDARGKWVGPPTFLLHGPPGTGKSLAARALAGTLGLPVHSISLAQTLGRYIGETEKSLGKSFQAAEEAGALLVLDEADTFIWDRADTNWAWERSHTNAILQLLDARTVPVVFTTNLGQRIDPAIQRRLQVVVEFPLPDRPCRERLWRLHLDRFEWGKVLLAVPLSKIVLTGALIANSVHAADRALRIGRVMQGNLTPWLIEEARRQATRLPACAKSLRFVGFRP